MYSKTNPIRRFTDDYNKEMNKLQAHHVKQHEIYSYRNEYLIDVILMR